MSEYGQVCGICGAHGDYCMLETPTMLTIDCRQLQLKNPDDLEGNIQMAANIREDVVAIAQLQSPPPKSDMTCPQCPMPFGKHLPDCTHVTPENIIHRVTSEPKVDTGEMVGFTLLTPEEEARIAALDRTFPEHVFQPGPQHYDGMCLVCTQPRHHHYHISPLRLLWRWFSARLTR